MFRLGNRMLFSRFYHPCRFTLTPQRAKLGTCALGNYVHQYRAHGHHYAKLDPLNLHNKEFDQFIRPTDLQITYQHSLSLFDFKSPIVDSSQSISQVEEKLQSAYLGSTGVQFQHLTHLEEKHWLYTRYEQLKMTPVPDEIKVRMAKTLIEAEAFQHFLHKKWVTFKRYSGEGAQSTTVALQQLFQLASAHNYEHLVFGMPHRGRFNILVELLNYQARHLFRKIAGKSSVPEIPNVIDDVTSHLAQSTTKKYGNKQLKVTLVHNPSHLQAQNPVSLGKAHSKQQLYGRDSVLNVQVHGDAAICGQGIVFQTQCLAKTPNFDVDGSIHIITNNQIGYTTRPIDSRPSKYATDMFKAFDVPVIHINSDDIEDVYRGVKLAIEYKHKYKKDFMIDLICYRKYGHNEVDEPQFTQPKMYNKIRKAHQPSPQKYWKVLNQQRLVDGNFYQNTRAKCFEQWQKQYSESQTIPSVSLQQYCDPKSTGLTRAFTELWSKYKPSHLGQQYPTGIQLASLKQFADASAFYPPNFAVHARIRRLHLQKRVKAIAANELDWATCQALAFFSLVAQGYNIRLTGQDVQRGTFSQRHVNLTDQNNEETFNPLQFFAEQQPGRGKVQILNSALSQNAVMSYQYGYSIDNPHNMAIWEAQFGDFFNTAQVAIDTYITNSQPKWLRQSGITLILPHGFDGAGPQHSSCRIQRFLQLANSDGSRQTLSRKQSITDRTQLKLRDNFFYQSIQDANFSLVYPTTPANYFHILRRQMKRNFRKPVVIAGPKALLRLSKCTSKFEHMATGSSFQPIIAYQNLNNLQSCEALILMTGKFVYDVQQIMTQKKSQKTCLLAIQELYPFPEAKLQQMIQSLPKNAKVYWIQEENFNGGAYQFVSNRISRVLSNIGWQGKLQYVGRRAISATAVGSSAMHKKQTQQLSDWIKDIVV